MKTYIVNIDYTRESEVKQHIVKADSSFGAVLEAGATAGRELGFEGRADSLTLISVEEIVEERKLVWRA